MQTNACKVRPEDPLIYLEDKLHFLDLSAEKPPRNFKDTNIGSSDFKDHISEPKGVEVKDQQVNQIKVFSLYQ